uniref:Uncharacterized protein n=1 Tax=Ditylenchus dipsaci TaxID=166011 RepID=A0A915E6P3_9BILA
MEIINLLLVNAVPKSRGRNATYEQIKELESDDSLKTWLSQQKTKWKLNETKDGVNHVTQNMRRAKLKKQLDSG